MLNRRIASLLAIGLFGLVRMAWAADQEGCLFCHRLELAKAGSAVSGLRVAETGKATHSELYCSDCHPDGKMTPHMILPGAARCIDECHSAGTGAVPESHRRAAFGGLTETHRLAAMPASPCTFCHKADDPPASESPAASRCPGCHPGQALSVSQGVHARASGKSGRGGCTGCHASHPATTAGKPPGKGATCSGPGCHAAVTASMRTLGTHGKGNPSERPSRNGAIALVASIAALGLLPGRLLCRNRPVEGGDAR